MTDHSRNRPVARNRGVENPGRLGTSLSPCAPLSPSSRNEPDSLPARACRGSGAQQGPTLLNVRPPGPPGPTWARYSRSLWAGSPGVGDHKEGAGHAPWEAPRVGENPSGPSRPPYLTGATSPGRHHGAAGPVHLLRRRHLPAPGPRPRPQPRPVPPAPTRSREILHSARPAGHRIWQKCLSHASQENPLCYGKKTTRPPYPPSPQPVCSHLGATQPPPNSKTFVANQYASRRFQSFSALELTRLFQSHESSRTSCSLRPANS